MKKAALEKLRRQARACGVQTEFIDAAGQHQEASAETLRAMVTLLGSGIGEGHAIPPVIVCWNQQPNKIRLHAGNAMPSSTRRAMPSIGSTQFFIQARSAERDVTLPVQCSSGTLHIPSLPFGYYNLAFGPGAEHRSLVISAPTKAYSQRGLHTWGVFVPMYALHSRRSWGAGDFSDWQRLCESLPILGRRVQRARPGTREVHRSAEMIAATLPLLGAFLDDWKCEPSPYSPATRLFWNEFYLDVTRVPEFASSGAAQRIVQTNAFQRELEQRRRSSLADYTKEMSLKRRVLEQLCQEFFRGSGRRREFETFCRRRPELSRYAAFRATCEQRREPWHSWPSRMRHGTLREGDYDANTQRYFTFVQWLAQEQMDAVLAGCRDRNVKFYLDLPLGVNPDGYDVWAHQDSFVHGANVGAPPDAFFTRGQDWGFPPPHPQRIRENGYGYVIDYLRFQMRHTGLLRLDHVMGLHRLWWVPRGASAADGAYVSYHAEEFYAILCLESYRHQTMLVGENLGTVPPEVNRSMKRHGIRSMYVTQYEQREDPRAALREPPRNCVASINTHDMPTWAAHWKGLDINDRQQLALLTPAQARDERKRRARMRAALEGFLRRKHLLSGKASARAVFDALVKFLAQSKAEVVLVNLEDLWLETKPQNTPGTMAERVNWRRKTRLLLEDLVK